jgi:Icc-related predicted phosphoesterase
MARDIGSNGAKPYAKMQILAVADVIEPRIYNESIKEWLSTVDLLVSCGDLPPHYLDFLMSTLSVPLVHVIGNHCVADHDIMTKRCSPEAYPGAYNLDGRVVEFNGLILAGLEGSPLYNMGPHQYTEQQIAWKLLKLSPALLREKLNTGRYLDVMVTHAPPRGIHDNQDLAHKGFESLLGFIDRFKPALLLHGHTHRYDPTLATFTHHGSTDIINVYGHSLITLVRDSEHSGWSLAAVPAH